jgi:hypothetical protein
MDFPSHRHKTHGAAFELRRLCYPWHRWYGRDVLTHRSGGVYAALSYTCRLPEEPDTMLQIPRWMFDIKICATMRVAGRPCVECSTLRELQTLIAERGATATAVVVQRQASQPIDGDADGKNPATRSAHATGPVLGKGRRAAVERTERTNASRGGKAPRAASTRGAGSRTAQRRSRR